MIIMTSIFFKNEFGIWNLELNLELNLEFGINLFNLFVYIIMNSGLSSLAGSPLTGGRRRRTRRRGSRRGSRKTRRVTRRR